jgi:hypothetical protein
MGKIKELTIEDEFAKILTEEMVQEMDNEIIESITGELLLLDGWVKAPFGTDKFTWPFAHQVDAVAAWIHANATDDYRISNKQFLFKSEQDLTAFILRWA